MSKIVNFRIFVAVAYIFIFAGHASSLERVNIAVPQQIFGDLRTSDILASLRIWTNTLIERVKDGKSDVDINFVVEDDLKAIQWGLESERLDMIIVLSTKFVELEKSQSFSHLRYPLAERDRREDLLLLVADDSYIDGFDDLKNRRVGVVHKGYLDLVRIWQEVFLLERGYGDGEEFYKKLTYHEKPNQAIFSLFFGQVDACFVNRSAYELMVELNPQVGRKLKVLECSKGYVMSVLAVRSSYDKPVVKSILRTLGNVNGTPEGEQIMTLFKFESMVSGDDAYLDPVRHLIRRYESLKNSVNVDQNDLGYLSAEKAMKQDLVMP